MSGCMICGGELMLLGALGNAEHYRCRCCGFDQTQAHDERDPDHHEDE